MFRRIRRFRLIWQRRARALRSCMPASNAAVRCNRRDETRPSSHHERINPDTAVCTWQTVHSGFFFPQPLFRLGQKQVADRTENQMPLEARIPPSFVMSQADFALVVLEAAFNAPTREGRQKDRPCRCFRRRIAHEELYLGWIKYTAGNHQMPRAGGQAIRSLKLKHNLPKSFQPILLQQDKIANSRKCRGIGQITRDDPVFC